MGAPMPGWPGSIQSGLLCLGQVMPVCFGVSHPLAGAAVPVLVCQSPRKPAGSGLQGGGSAPAWPGLPPAPGHLPPWAPAMRCHRGDGEGQSPPDAEEKLLAPWPPAVCPSLLASSPGVRPLPTHTFTLPSWPRLPGVLVFSSLNPSQNPS